MLPLFRAVLVWVAILVTVILPRLDPPAQHSVAVAVTQLSAFDRNSVMQQSKNQRVQAAQMAQVQSWSVAAAIAARSNHPAPPPEIAKDITDAFSPLGPAAVQWAMNVAWCESRYHPNSVNTDSGASGLFQFLPSTWGGTPYAKQSPFDPRANAFAAAWLYSHYGPGRWVCQG